MRKASPPGPAGEATAGRSLDRLVIQDVRPSAPHGYPAKAVVGESVPVRANIFRDGHDLLAARALLRNQASGEVVATCTLHELGNDEWAGTLVPNQVGAHQVVVEAWTDRYATWAHRATIKLGARQDVSVEIAEAVALLAEAESAGDGHPELARVLAALQDNKADAAGRLVPALATPVAQALRGGALAADRCSCPPLPLWVERERALVGAWYELFPRSFGGLRGAARELPRLSDLGFDVLYLPPVHPIGHTFRKGKNGALVAREGDPGSPWAIGSEAGGHTSVHPELGTLEDFDFLVSMAAGHGLEVALDYALQCSPDHPWVSQHPEWFHHRPDGTIAYAENPPKKYQDIYPLNFWPETDADRLALWDACRDVLFVWADRGVRIFRVDNPHTKPFAFWEWLVPQLRGKYPDAILLAEAFTRPKVMARLAEVGFSQSYTYFAWRTAQYGPEGIRTYVEELAHGPLADYMRPNFWPSTPDILSGPLREGPPAAFALRFVLAATLAPSYGIYSGYELYENTPASSDNEEYLGSEKYEIKHRDFSRTGTLGPLIKAVNGARHRHRALARLRNVFFHGSDNPNVLAYSKASDDGSDVVLMVVTLDPSATQESTLHLDMAALGLPPDQPFVALDELSGERYTWGPHPYVRFDPWRRVAHLLDLRRPGAE